MKIIKRIIIFIIVILSVFFTNSNFSLANSLNDISNESPTVKAENKRTGNLKYDILIDKPNTINEYSDSLENIYPGCEGNIVVKIKNSTKGFVKTNLYFFDEKDKPEHLNFRYNGKTFSSLTDINNELKSDEKINKDDLKEINIEYFWNFEDLNKKEYDLIDTKDNGKKYTFRFKLNVEYEEFKKLPRTGTECNYHSFSLVGLNILLISILLNRIKKEEKI